MNKSRHNAKIKSYRNKFSKKNYKIINNFEREIVIKLLSASNNVKLFHWKTQIYSTHKATDELYANLNNNIDTFIEVLLGKIGNRINLLKINSIPVIHISSDDEMYKEMNNLKNYLINLDNNNFMNIMSNSDLFTIRDQILLDINQFLYLLSFK